MEWTQEEPEEPDDNLSNLLKFLLYEENFYHFRRCCRLSCASCFEFVPPNLAREVSIKPLCDLLQQCFFIWLDVFALPSLHRSIQGLGENMKYILIFFASFYCWAMFTSVVSFFVQGVALFVFAGIRFTSLRKR